MPNQTLVWLRIALGLLGGADILGNGIYYHWYKGDFDGFTFRYYGFEWVHPLPEPFFSLFFVLGFLLGVAVALGWRFRITAPLFALSFTYLFLLEKAHYLNHAYLFCWLSWVLILTPAWREFALDVRREPKHWSPVTPRWAIAIFPLLMGVVYFFGGIAKINHDWLLEAMPLHIWIKSRGDIPIVGHLFTLKPTAYFMAWGGFLLDLLIAFFLLHKRLRWLALAAAFFFHATNHLIFNIGIFPYLSLVMTSLFFEPDWPGRFLHWLGRRCTFIKSWQTTWRLRVNPDSEPVGPSLYTGHTPFKGVLFPEVKPVNYNASAAFGQRAWLLPTFIVILLIHVFLPLRHHLFASDVAWSEEGHRYSWRMMLRSKVGYGNFKVANPETGEQTTIILRDSLNSKQVRKLYTHPDMILQYAHYLAEQYGKDCAVYANIKVKLNHGMYAQYIDPAVDLSKVEWEWFKRKDWILAEQN